MVAKVSTAYLLAGGIVAAALVYVIKRPGEAGQALGSAAVDLAGGVLGGVALGVGDALGVPRTDETECQRAKREGRTLDASFSCPAGEFISWWWNK